MRHRHYLLLGMSLLMPILCFYFLSKPPPLLDNISYSQVITDHSGKVLSITLSNDDKYRLMTPLAAIQPNFIRTILLKEDAYFYNHPGVNPIALTRAMVETYFLHHRRQGASTLTMQVARLRYHLHTKTLAGKLLQICCALQLERYYSKNEILTAYFNLAPFGHNIEGIGAASFLYFKKKPDQLSVSEILLLANLPQNPNIKLNPDNIARLQNLIKNKNQQSIFTFTPILFNLKDKPFLAPHFVQQILAAQDSEKGDVLQTTLDWNIQQLLEKVTREYTETKKYIGMENAGMLLIDTRDMAVKAMVGSVDFYNARIHGEINTTHIKRSPGSTLKPFIYALAFDQGLIHPATVLKDVPHRYTEYNPENFDHDFLGPVTAENALILSRNMPALFLAAQLKNPSLYDFLKEAQVKNLKAENQYGIALALGDADLTLQELATLYAMLVNQGVWHSLRLMQNAPFDRGKRLLSKEASFLVLDILAHTPRENIPDMKLPFPIAYKTGTSSGFRDAWTIGALGPYVLAVWVGNADAHGNSAFVGKEIAVPLFFAAIHAITSTQKIIALKPDPHLNLVKIPVCKASGLLPTPYCHDTTLTWFIPGKSPIIKDNIFREIAINRHTGLRTCHLDNNTQFKIYEFWSSDFLQLFKEAGMAKAVPPPYEPGCETMANNTDAIYPEITSPTSGLHYILQNTTAKTNTIPLLAVSDADVKWLYWFLNNTYIGRVKVNTPFLWQAKRGKYTLRVLDDHGNADVEPLQVEEKE